MSDDGRKEMTSIADYISCAIFLLFSSLFRSFSSGGPVLFLVSRTQLDVDLLMLLLGSFFGFL